MTSPFNGKWRLYGTENARLFAESFHLPPHIASTIVHLRTREEVHVNDSNVHIRLEIPQFEVPGYTVEKNAIFGQVCNVPLITTGSSASGYVTKVSETMWVANLTCARTNQPVVVTREIVGGEMWVSIEARGHKMIHKFERTAAVPCPITGEFPATVTSADSVCTASACPAGKESADASCPPTCSPFAGSWSMYGSEGGDQFYAAADVPETIRNLLAHARIYETVHVNNIHAHVRICVAPIHVPPRVHEENWTFGEEHDYSCPFTNATGKATATQISDTKWTGTVSLKDGEMLLTREVVNGEMWLTLETVKGKVIRKYERYNHPHHDHEHHDRRGHHERHGHHEHH